MSAATKHAHGAREWSCRRACAIDAGIDGGRKGRARRTARKGSAHGAGIPRGYVSGKYGIVLRERGCRSRTAFPESVARFDLPKHGYDFSPLSH